MADTKITALTAITTVDPAVDVLPIVDVSDTTMAASGTTKKITSNQILGAGGTATLASATITGDLTVDTSTLKVDSANNRVIVGHTSGSSAFQVTNAGAAGLEIQPTGFSSAPLILSYNRSGSAYTQLTLDGSTIVHALNGSTAMTLNSTGLGVGVASPAQRLHVKLDQNAYTYSRIDNQNASSGAYAALMLSASGNSWGIGVGSAAANSNALDFFLDAGGANSLKMRLDSSGNVGIGVTPSAWDSNFKALQIGYPNFIAGNNGGNRLDLGVNAYFSTNYKYAATGSAASFYSQAAGVHSWSTAPSGTAGNAITFTQAMTLDASGNLAIGSAATGTRRLEVKSAGTSNTTFAAHFRDSADTLLFHVRSDGYFNTGQGTLSPYNNTTASAANMFVDSSGFVYRSTSSLKYKTDVKDSIHGLADVLKLRSVTYKSKNGDDTVFGGLIAEEVHAAGLTEFVAYAPDKTPDSINYGNMVALLVSAIKELTARVQTLEAK